MSKPSLLLAALLLAALARPAAAGGLIWRQWLTSLQQAGYALTQGAVAVETLSYCQRVVVPLLGQCNGNDPSDPYILPLMPFGAGTVDPYFGSLGQKTLPGGTVVGQIFQLADTEAELIIVTLPPLAAYFSFQNDVYTRLSADYPHGATHLSLDPARGELRATYNNSTNNIDILRQSGLGFAQGTIAIIATPNTELANDMRRRFAALGGNPALIFTSAIGANVITGLDAAADDYNSLLRYLGPRNLPAAHRWLTSANNNVQVYRVDQPQTLPVARVPTQATYPKTAYATNESVYAADLAELSALMQTWLATQDTQTTYYTRSFGVSETVSATGTVTGEYGPICIAYGLDCVGDEQDTAAYFNRFIGQVGANQAFVVDGVNHAVTRNATIISLAVIDSTTNTGTLGVSQTNPAAAGFSAGTLTGSAEAALKQLGLWSMASPSLQQDAPKLYVQIFTRGCTAQQTYCARSFTKIIDSSIPYAHSIVLTARAYLLPGSRTGANPDALLPPQAIF